MLSHVKKLYSVILNKLHEVSPEEVEFVNRLIAKARYEFHSPPIHFKTVISPKTKSLKFKLSEGVGRIIIPKFLLDEDLSDIVLWFIRHILSHIHYCPYDLKTAYQLQKLAFKETMDWNLAYIALYFLSELQIDLIYLPRRYGQIPSYLLYRFRDRPEGLMEVLYSAYKHAFPQYVERYNLDPLIEDFGKQLVIIISQLRPWSVKVRMIAALLSRLRILKPSYFKPKLIKRMIESAIIPIKEDITREAFRTIREIYGEIKDIETARQFYQHWIKPRVGRQISKETIEKLMKELSKKMKGEAKERVSSKEVARYSTGEEPIFPTSYSKPLTKINKLLHEEALWRRYWLKARAENILLNYEIVSKYEKPTWTILAYPDQWLIEDDIETLDVEASLDEGKLRPEINTVKWVEIPSRAGYVISSGYAPSAIVVLDSSISMQEGLINAMTAAFIAYLSAKKAGGKVAVINFSTNFIAGEWDTSDDIKELILAYNLKGYTILPVHEIERLVRLIGDRTFIIIISDCGWQNLEEALKRLEILGQRGHTIIIFHIYGWRYKRHIARILKSPYVKIIHVDEPEKDLEGLVLREALSIYGTYMPRTLEVLTG